jgi:hypothetical protein
MPATNHATSLPSHGEGLWAGLKMTPDELAILKGLAEKKPLEEIAKATGMGAVVVGQAVARLQLMGLISDNGSLTDTGSYALRNEPG